MADPAEITLEGAPNFRDLGGYRTSDGHIVRTGHLFRSGHLALLTDRDLHTLTRLGIRTVVDFRPRAEQDMFGGDRLPPDVEYTEIPIGDPAAASAWSRAVTQGDFTLLPDLRDANRLLLRNHSTAFRKLFALVADTGRHPLVFHCIGGKDRTGLGAALVLTALGVPWATVVQDYQRSNDRIREAVAEQVAHLAGPDGPGLQHDANLDALRRFFVVDASYLDAARDEAARIAGSLDNYIATELGFGDEQRKEFRNHLLEPS